METYFEPEGRQSLMAKAKSSSTGWLWAVGAEPGVASRRIGACTGFLDGRIRTSRDIAANKKDKLTGKRLRVSAVPEQVRSADDGRETRAVGLRSEERR